jgi:hypothetical protein
MGAEPAQLNPSGINVELEVQVAGEGGRLAIDQRIAAHRSIGAALLHRGLAQHFLALY